MFTHRQSINIVIDCESLIFPSVVFTVFLGIVGMQYIKSLCLPEYNTVEITVKSK